MAYDRAIEEAVQKLAGTYLKDVVSIIQCVVNSYDVNALTCDCTPLSDYAITDIPGVQLSAEVSDGLVVFPTVNSTVYVALTTRNTAFLLLTSDIDKVQITIPTGTPNKWTKLIVSSSGIQFNDGSLGGLVEIVNLVTKLNNLENRVNDLITQINTHVHSGVTTGVGVSGVNTTPDTDGPITPTVRANIENTLITQGI